MKNVTEAQFSATERKLDFLKFQFSHRAVIMWNVVRGTGAKFQKNGQKEITVIPTSVIGCRRRIWLFSFTGKPSSNPVARL